MQAAKLKKIATPPNRGSGSECRCRSLLGAATHARAFAKSRMNRVSTKDKHNANKNVAKKIGVKCCDPQTGTVGISTAAPLIGKVLLHLPLG